MRRMLIVAMAVLAFAAGAADAIRWRTPTYTLIARQMSVREAFDAFAVAQGLSVVMSQSVTGSFSGDFRDLPSQEFLSRVCTMHNLTWYYDGAALYIYSAGEILTTLTDLAFMKAEDVSKLLRELGVEDSRFPIKTASDGEIIMVSGPPRYVELVLQTIAKADRLKQIRTFNQIDTRIFPLRNTWADCVSLNVTGPESSVRINGVAQLLQEIMGNGSSGRQSKDIETNAVETAESKVLDAMNSTFSPVIRPDNRMNAVIVRDSVTRMPMYEKLIADLDKPQKLIEVQITTLEMTRDDSLDWQLSLAVGTTEDSYGHGQAAGGTNARNLFSPDNLGGKGLSGAATFIDKNIDIQGSISALRTKGKARNISRTSLLTLNNMAAEMSDTQSYHARCVGTEVATLQEVSAGTRLAIKPRVVPPATTNAPGQVWLAMELQDGGFETIAVDSMPMKRTSTLETQAAVFEGQSVLLAGYFRDIQEDAGWGIPFLRDLPLIGWIFGGSSVHNDTVQRLFVLTPRVIDITAEDVLRIQATNQRDVRQEEALENDRNIDSDARMEREIRNQEREDNRRAYYEDRMEKLNGEIEFRKAQRDRKRDAEREKWYKDIEERIRNWQETPEK